MTVQQDLIGGGISPLNEATYYQREAVEAVEKSINNGKRPLLIMATGTGKTVVAALVLKNLIQRNEATLFLAHREELIFQAQATINTWAGHWSGIEMAKSLASHVNPVVIASVQSMNSRRLEKWPLNQFGYIITDEAHHSVAPSYRKIYDHFMIKSHLGMTATPDRADERNHLSEIYDEIAYEYSLIDAIRDDRIPSDRRLVPIVGRKIENFDIDLNELRITYGDYRDNDLGRVISDHIAQIAGVIREEIPDKKTLIFTPTVDSAQLLSEALEGAGIKSAWLSGASDKQDRRDTLNRFSRGIITHLVGCSLFLEGFDEPSIECITNLRPTGSRALYTQMVGRGTRPSPGKSELLLLEFTFNSQRLKLVTPFELFSTAGYGERVQSIAEKSYRGDTNILDALEEAHNYRYSMTGIMDNLILNEYNVVRFDPLTLGDMLGVDISGEFDLQYNGRKIEGTVTHKQIDLLGRYGIDARCMDRAQASMLINELFSNNHIPFKGPATPAQRRYLRKNGYPANMTKAQASLLIAKLKEKEDERARSFAD